MRDQPTPVAARFPKETIRSDLSFEKVIHRPPVHGAPIVRVPHERDCSVADIAVEKTGRCTLATSSMSGITGYHAERRDGLRHPHFSYYVGRTKARDRAAIHREDPLDFETHGIVAFARHRCEPQWVNLDFSSPFRSDRSGSAQVAHQERHCRSSHTQYLRKRLLGECEDVVVARSRRWSSQRAMRAWAGCSALQAPPICSCISIALK